MRKLKLFFACLLMAVLSIGQMWGGTATETIKMKGFASITATGYQNITKSGTSDENSLGMVAYAYIGSSGQVRGNKTSIAGASVTSADNSKNWSLYNSDAMPGAITAIKVTGSVTGTNKFQNKLFVSLGTSSQGAVTSVDDAQEQDAGATATEINFTIDATKGYTYFKLLSNQAFTSGAVTDVKVEVTYSTGGAPAPTLTAVTVSGAPTKTSYYAGDNFDPAGLTVTGTYSDESTAPITSGITWSYDPSQELALNQTSIGVIATVSEIASPKFNVTGLTVTAATVYELITSTAELEEGAQYIIANTSKNTAMGEQKSTNRIGVAVTINSNKIIPGDDVQIITLGKDNGNWTFYTGSGYLYAASSDNNHLKTQTTNDANGQWTIEIAANGDATITAQGTNTRNLLRCNNNGTPYSCYSSGQQPVHLFKKADGRQAAGLAYAEADLKKLAKLDDAFTAPTLVNPNNLTVDYASNNTDVAEVVANGAVTIKAAGVAVITASFAGNDDYKAGSASYTIGVTAHAGTEADPYNAADVKTAIDVMGTVANAYASGIVSKVVTATLPSDGYITFDFSADGATTGQQIEAYKCYGLNSAPFEALSDVETGATVVVTGNLKKYNSTYEFDANCHLVSYTAPAAPKTPIANDQAHPYTVAQAITFAADGVTYDLDDYVYVQGVVYDVKSFNTTNGTLDIYIKDAGEENQFELYKCAGINDGVSTTPFEALTDVQEGDEVIAYGQLTVFNTMSELKSGNYLVELTRPEVAVSSVAMTESTAEVEVGSTVTLHASVDPGNATDQGIVWSVTSGSDKASVDENGVVTGTAAGEAVIRAASHEDASIYEECTVTVTAVDPTKHVVTFDATVDMGESPLSKSNISMACTSGALGNGSEYRLYKSSTTTFECSVGNITKIEFTGVSGNPVSGFGDPEVGTLVTEGNDGVWTGNAASVSFVASGAQVRATKIKVTYKEDNREDADLEWSTDAIVLTVGNAFTPANLVNPNGIAAGEITIESDNTDLAIVTAGVVSLVADATGEATITATFAGNDDYKPATISYNITVNEAGLDNVTFDSSEDHAESGETTITKGGFTLSFTSGSMDGTQAEYRLYKGQTMTLSSTDYKIKKIEFTCTSGNPISGFADAAGLDKDNNEWTGESNTLELTASNAQVRMTKIKVFYVDDSRAASGLAWDPVDDIELTVGDAFSAPTLLNPNSIDASEFTIESSNENVATINNSGEVELVADATGTTTITATFAGNDDFKPATISYKITVNPAYSIYVTPSLNVNFGSVEQDAVVADKKVTVTFTNVPAATLTLEGAGSSAFAISPAAAMTASGDITISASSANVGTFAATLTISDDDNNAESKVVNLSITVNEPVIAETPVSTSSEWVVATAVADGMEVLITGVKDDVTYAMSVQSSNGNNRTTAAGSVNGDIFTPGENTMSFTLVAQEGDNKYALRTSNEKYLFASSGSANRLGTRDEIGDDGKAVWTISIGEGNVASIVANCETTNWRNTMRFNQNGQNNPVVACYASASQDDIKLYVPKPAPTAEIVRGELNPGQWGTLCPTQNISEVEGAEFFQISYLEELGGVPYNMVFDAISGTTLEAGKPYFFIANAGEIRGIKTGTVLDEADQAGVNGFYGYIGAAPMDLTWRANYDGNENNTFVIYNNSVFRITGDTQLKSERCYININSTEPSRSVSQPAPGRRRINMAVSGTQVATGIDAINASEKPVKMMIDGQLFIIRGEKMYDATGRLVK